MELRPGVLRISPGCLAASAVLYLWLGGRGLAILLLCVLVHEAGHLLALRCMGCRVRKIRAGALGAVIVCGPMAPEREAASAAAGPAASLLLAAVGALFAQRCPGGTCALLAGTSAAIGAFNLLPVVPMDGGRILCSLLEIRFGCDTARRVCRIAGLMTAGALAASGAAMFRSPIGWALLCASVRTAIHYCKNGRFGIKSMG